MTKKNNKAVWALAWMFLIVGARFQHSWIEWKEVLHSWFVCKIVYHIERFFCRCLINETEFWCYMSKEGTTATLRESLASRLQMSGGPPNGSRSSATPVTVREAAARNRQLINKRVQLNSALSMLKIASETGMTRIGPPNNQTRVSTQAVQASSKGFHFWRLTTREYDWKDDSFVASHLWTGGEFCSRWKAIH